MCRMCEGISREQLLDEARCHIIHHGWFLQGIVPAPNETGATWVYTVGLLENFDHPELVVTDISYEQGGALLNELGELVRRCLATDPRKRFADGDALFAALDDLEAVGRSPRWPLPIAALAVLAFAVGGALAVVLPDSSEPAPLPKRLGKLRQSRPRITHRCCTSPEEPC